MTAAGAAALARDPTFPRRDELLDEGALRARLSDLLGAEVERCERVRATYHPNRSLRVLLQVETEGMTRWISGRMFAAGASASRFERVRGDGRVFHDEELATVFSAFPADRKLAALQRLAGEGWPGVAGAPHASVRFVAYAPEKSATAVAVDGAGRATAFLKLYSDATASRTVGVHHALLGCGLRVPSVLAFRPDLRALAVEPVHGARLADADGVRGWRALGAALARLHRLRPVDERRSTRLEPRALRAAATTIAAVRPDVAARAFELERTLRQRVPAVDSPTVCLHGDVHPKNVLVDATEATLVDLDDIAGGKAAADLGGALAGLRYDALLGRARPAHAEALLDGYREHAPPPDPRVLRWYTAAALLGERAVRSITRVRTAGLERLDAVLAAGLEEIG